MSCNPIPELLHCFQREQYYWHHSIDNAQSKQAHTVNSTFSIAQNCTATTPNKEIWKKGDWHHIKLPHQAPHATREFSLSNTCCCCFLCDGILISCKLSMGQDCSDVHIVVPIIISVFITQKQACTTNGDNNYKKLTKRVKKEQKYQRNPKSPVRQKIQKLELLHFNFKFVVCHSPKAQWQKYQSTKYLDFWSLLYAPIKWGKISINQILWYLILVMPHYKTPVRSKTSQPNTWISDLCCLPHYKTPVRSKTSQPNTWMSDLCCLPHYKTPVRSKTSQPNTWMSDLYCLSKSKRPMRTKTSQPNTWMSDLQIGVFPSLSWQLVFTPVKIGKINLF